MILDDGYTETLEGHEQFRFRRFLTSERKEFRELLKQERYSAAREYFSRHISDPDGKRVPAELVADDVAFAITQCATEKADLENLRSGMKLMLTNPRLALRPCSLCQSYWFDEDTGTITEVGGVKLLRPDFALPRCRITICPKGTPEQPLSFNERNQKAFDHWMQWRSVGCPDPHDAIVRRNWMWFELLKEKHGLRELRTKLSGPANRG